MACVEKKFKSLFNTFNTCLLYCFNGVSYSRQLVETKSMLGQFPSLRSRRLEVMSARKNRRVRGRLFPFFLAPTTQNISLLPKTVTEAHANLKKKKSSCNTTLKYYAVEIRSSLISSLIC